MLLSTVQTVPTVPGVGGRGREWEWSGRLEGFQIGKELFSCRQAGGVCMMRISRVQFSPLPCLLGGGVGVGGRWGEREEE